MSRQPGTKNMTMEDRLQLGLEQGGLTEHDADAVRSFAQFLEETGRAKVVERTDLARGRMMRATAIADMYERDGEPQLLRDVWKHRHVALYFATMIIAKGGTP